MKFNFNLRKTWSYLCGMHFKGFYLLSYLHTVFHIHILITQYLKIVLRFFSALRREKYRVEKSIKFTAR